MQAYAEGFDIFRNANLPSLPEGQRYDLDLADIAEVWRRGSVVSSWLLDLTASALAENPDLSELHRLRAGFRRRALDDAGGDRGGGAGATCSPPRCSTASARARSTPSATRCSPPCATSSAATWSHRRNPDEEEGEAMSTPGASEDKDAEDEIERTDEWVGHPAPPCAMVIFGATGDLTKRKLIPALYNLLANGLLPEEFAVVGVGRSPLPDEEFRDRMEQDLQEFATAEVDGREARSGSRSRLRYVAVDPEKPKTFKDLPADARQGRRRAGHAAATTCITSPCRRAFRRLRPLPRRRGPDARGGGALAARDHREAVRPRPRVGARAEPADPRGPARSGRSTGSITTSARRPCRTSWCSASPTASSSRSGTAATSITCRSPSPKRSASRGAAATTRRPARCATWCRTTCSSSSR